MSSPPQQVLIDHPVLHHVWNPGTQYTHTEYAERSSGKYEPYTHSYNAQSWIEEYDVPVDKPPGTYRIFYLGDSFTEGCVPMDQSVPSVIERRLKELRCNATFEVINTGTSSYSPLIYLVLLRKVLPQYRPDLIVVNVDLTDDFDDWKYHHTAQHDEENVPVAVAPGSPFSAPDTVNFWQRLRVFLYRNSALFNVLMQVRDLRTGQRVESERLSDEAATALHKRGQYTRWSWTRDKWDDLTKTNVERTLQSVALLVREARQQQIKVVVTGVPHHEQFVIAQDGAPLWSRLPYDLIRNEVEKNGGVFMDSVAALSPLFLDTPHDQFYYPGDIHLNPEGNRRWASVHEEFLLNPAYALVPAACTRQP